MTTNLPTGTVTFLFTDIEGSTQLWEKHPQAMKSYLARHDSILRESVETNHGHVIKTTGDGIHAVFSTALDGISAAIAAQRALIHNFEVVRGSEFVIRVRMGLHTGDSERRDGDYYGQTLNRAARIMSAGHGGQVLLSEITARVAREHLPKEISCLALGEHRLKGLLEPERIYQVMAHDLPQSFPPLRTLDAHPNNLPAQLTSFVGREKEIAQLKQELDEHRLVTLIGSGGTGKTRLSLQVAEELLDRFDHGVWFIELAPLADPNLIPQTILSAIGIHEQPGRNPMDVLKDYLYEKKSLIVLDNCEHLVSASAQVANTLLNAAPKLKILASSREALGIKGEQSYPVPSLSLPDPKRLPVFERLSQYEAVRLFIDRALLVLPHFVVDKDNAPYIAQICHQLDGIPLAIELAAARVKLLSVEQVSIRLDDRFRLLTGGARTALPRQQTLRACIDWSYDLLSENERLLLRRLSVFAGGWTLEDAEMICSGDGIESYDVLDLLSQLVNRSLAVVIDQSQRGETRFRMLETIRQYAREKLFASGERDELHDRHFDYFLQMVIKARSEYFSPKEMLWLVWLEYEWDNLRAAVEWSSKQYPKRALELVNNLGDLFLINANNASEMDDWLTQLLADVRNSTRTVHRARGLYHWALYADYSRENGVLSEAMIEEGLSICAELGDKDGLAHGYLIKVLGIYDLENPSQWYEKAVDLFRETQNKLWLAHTLQFYGRFLQQWEVERKLAYLEESLSIQRELGYTTGIIESLKQLGAIHIRVGDFESAHRVLHEGFSIMNTHVSVLGNSITMSYDLGDLAFFEGHYDLAQEYYEEALSWAYQKGLPAPADHAKVRLGYLFLQKSELEKANSFFHQALPSFLKYGDKYDAVFTLEGFAGLAIARQQWEKAIRLFSSLNSQREKMQFQRPPVEQIFIHHKLATIHSQLDEVTFEKVWNEGSALTLEQAIALALQEEKL